MLLIGDVHGKVEQYLEITREYSSSVQLGDMGFDYSHFKGKDEKERIRLKSHKFFLGNHDDPHKAKDCPNNLGDFGLGFSGGRSFFFVRGAYSIDKPYRTEGLDWFKEEELNFSQCNNCLDIYKSLQNNDRELILSHEAPYSVIRQLWGYPLNHTSRFLEFLLQIHRPKVWVFGHHHKSVNIEIDGTRFICLKELETLEL